MHVHEANTLRMCIPSNYVRPVWNKVWGGYIINSLFKVSAAKELDNAISTPAKQLKDKDTDILWNDYQPTTTCSYIPRIATSLLLHRAICNIFLQLNVLRWGNNIFIHWCRLLLLLLVEFCHGVNLVALGFLPHSTVVHHSTNQCSNDE